MTKKKYTYQFGKSFMEIYKKKLRYQAVHTQSAYWKLKME